MADRDNLDSVRLNDAAARRLLERATELDARLASESTVADLREAARAAGISDEAFQRALAEVRQENAPVVAATPATGARPSSRMKMVVVLAAFVVLGLGVLFYRAVVVIPNEAVPAKAEYQGPAPAEPAPAPAPVPTKVPKR